SEFGKQGSPHPLFLHYNGIRFTTLDILNYSFYINHGISAANGVGVIAAEADNKSLVITIRRN
ncbi:MAG: hypothetical protein PHP42_13450, partial [Bacteroidota bacterium]|nr:hypothetical protein [Bacteroidota bacterium]